MVAAMHFKMRWVLTLPRVERKLRPVSSCSLRSKIENFLDLQHLLTRAVLADGIRPSKFLVWGEGKEFPSIVWFKHWFDPNKFGYKQCDSVPKRGVYPPAPHIYRTYESEPKLIYEDNFKGVFQKD